MASAGHGSWNYVVDEGNASGGTIIVGSDTWLSTIVNDEDTSSDESEADNYATSELEFGSPQGVDSSITGTALGLSSSSGGDDDNESGDKVFDEIEQFLKRKGFNFDVKAWMERIPNWIPALKDMLFPGSFNHFLLVLLASPEELEATQREMHRFLLDHYIGASGGPIVGMGADAAQMEPLWDELNALRALFKPVREISYIQEEFWDDQGEVNTAKLDSLKKGTDMIEKFESDILSGILHRPGKLIPTGPPFIL